MSKVTAPALDSQLPLPILARTERGGAVFLGWGLPALQRYEKDKRAQPRDPCPLTLALPLFGVQPGADWREHTATETKLERLPAHYLELRRNPREKEWTADDWHVRAEIMARTVTMHTALRWKAGTPVPPWFLGLVPTKLLRFVALVWTAYSRRAFGVRDTQIALASALGVTPRTIRNWLREAEGLGLISSVKLWQKIEGETMADVLLLRPGAVVETIAGLASFEFQRKIRATTVRATFPGELRAVPVTKKAAASRSASLRKASDRFYRDQRAAYYRGERKLQASPEVFAAYLADVLEDQARHELEPSRSPDPAPEKRRETPRQCADSPKTDLTPGSAGSSNVPDEERCPDCGARYDDQTQSCPSCDLKPDEGSIDFAAAYLLSSALAGLAGAGAATRELPPPGDGPSVAEGGRGPRARANRTTTPPSPHRKNVPDIHGFLKKESATQSDDRSSADWKGIFPPSATDGPSPGGGSSRVAAPAPASPASAPIGVPRELHAECQPCAGLRAVFGDGAPPCVAHLEQACIGCLGVGLGWIACPLCGKRG